MIFKKEDGSVKELTEEELQNVLANVANNISNTSSGKDLFFQMALQTLLLKYAADVLKEIFDK